MELTDTLPFHHAPGGGFRNLPGSPKRAVSLGEMTSFLLKQMTSVSAPPVPPDHVLSKAETMSQMAAARNPSVTWLGHAAFIIRVGGKTVLTDPFLGDTAGPSGFGPKRFVPSALTVEELPRADVMVVSHNHYDHLDADAISSYGHKESTQVIVPLGLGPFFEKRGYPEVVEQDWWQTWEEGELAITTLPAVHFSGRGFFDRNETLWASFSIASKNERTWFSGDTARGEIFSEIGERYGPFDLALIAVGAYEPRNIMEAVHASPEEAVEIARTIRARKTIGMHWGTIMLTPENPFEAPDRFRQAAIDQGYGAENAWIMRIGETRSIRSPGEQGPTEQ